jgi:hypothetical protein
VGLRCDAVDDGLYMWLLRSLIGLSLGLENKRVMDQACGRICQGGLIVLSFRMLRYLLLGEQDMI